jgi:hypothetical protein
MTVMTLSISNLVFCIDKIFYHADEKLGLSYLNGVNAEPLVDNTPVKIVKSFKNSSGFYKINGTLENQGPIIFSDIKVIKYYKIPSVNDTTLICYEESDVRCEYKSLNQLPSESFFLNIPDPQLNYK